MFGDSKVELDAPVNNEFKNSAVKNRDDTGMAKDKSKAEVENKGAKDAVIEVKDKSVNETNKATNDTAKQVLKGVEEKVIAIGESVKNKTLAKLVDLGVIKNVVYEKLVYERTKWSLNLSIEDIGNIMKDTEYFQKKQNLTEMEYQPLLQPNSNGTKTVNVTDLDSSYGLGYCDCKEFMCICCVRVFNKRMRLNSTACATITFSSKSQVSV